MTDAPRTSPFAPAYADEITEWEEVNGCRVPGAFVGSSVDAEYTALRTAVIAQDYSVLGKWYVEGPDARATVDAVYSRDVRTQPVHRISYGVIVNDDGGMIDDVTVTVLADDQLLVLGAHPRVLDDLRAAAPAGTTVTDRRADFGVLSIQGPRSRELLQRLTDADVSNEALPYYDSAEIDVAGIPATVFRLGFVAELGYEVQVPAADAPALYRAVFAQTDLGVHVFTGATLMTARLEAGLMLADVDYDETVTPYECRLGWTVDLDKAPFQGQEALRRLRDDAPLRTVTVVTDAAPEELEGADLIDDGGDVVGSVPMAVTSPILDGRTTGLARLRAGSAKIGTRLVARVDGVDHDVDVRATPIHDPERLRVRA